MIDTEPKVEPTRTVALAFDGSAPGYTKRDQMLATAPQANPTPMRVRSPRASAATESGDTQLDMMPCASSPSVGPGCDRAAIACSRSTAAARAPRKIRHTPQNGNAAANAYSTTISPITMTGGYPPRLLQIGSAAR